MGVFGFGGKKRRASTNVGPVRPSVSTLPFEGAYVYLLIGLLGYMAADLSILAFQDRMLPASPPKGRSKPAPVLTKKSRQEYENIIARNIFNADGKIPPAVGATESTEEEVETDIPVLSSLPLELKGTIVHSNPARSLATIELKSSGKTLPFAPNDDMEGLGKLVRVERKKAIFRNRNNNRLEFIEIKDSGPKARISTNTPTEEISGTGNQFTVKRAEVNRLLDNLPEVLQQARAVPNILPGTGGRVDGFKVLDIAPGSIFEKIGIKRMDVIKRVNGQEVNSPAKAMELYQQLKGSGYVQIEVERNGGVENLNYSIVE